MPRTLQKVCGGVGWVGWVVCKPILVLSFGLSKQNKNESWVNFLPNILILDINLVPLIVHIRF